ncbi:hypothetical protein [Erysipelatoclostridium sp. DFI.2.3]|nr:hypothetical protein [Erysipelatoclostridium sp. DFI.2.3]EQJ51948.1 hypothetical protein QSI_4204 [Clostridioides difficile P28]
MANKDMIFITRESNTKCKKENPSTAIMVAALNSHIFYFHPECQGFLQH